MPVVDIQRRMMELGRIRLGGEKTPKQPGKKLEHFRLTSHSKVLLESAAEEYGGTVKPWESPDGPAWQLYTETSEMEIILPPVFSDVDGSPTAPYSQWYELWSGGGCQRRCDGLTESISGGACLCDPEKRECALITRISLMLPRVPGIGIWLVQSHGYYAAAETTGTLSVLQRAAEGQEFIPAVLRLEQRSVKRPGEPTRRFNVPVVDLPETRVAELLPGSQSKRALPAPKQAAAGRERPPLPAGETTPPSGEAAAFETDQPSEWGDDIIIDVRGGESEPTNEPLIVTDQAETNDQLTARLSQLLLKLGQGDAADMIPKMRRNQGDGPKHEQWLRRQIANAEKKMDQRQNSQEGRET